MEEKDVVKVTIHYEDGTTEEVEKGIVITEEEGEDVNTARPTFYPVNMEVLDVASMTVALMQFADRLGVFDRVKERER